MQAWVVNVWMVVDYFLEGYQTGISCRKIKNLRGSHVDILSRRLEFLSCVNHFMLLRLLAIYVSQISKEHINNTTIERELHRIMLEDVGQRQLSSLFNVQVAFSLAVESGRDSLARRSKRSELIRQHNYATRVQPSHLEFFPSTKSQLTKVCFSIMK